MEELQIRLVLPDGHPLRAAAVLARNVRICASPAELLGEFPEEAAMTDARKESVRALLKAGGYKPSGRSKPASEYLLQAFKEGRFPSINNLVDINNLISLHSGLPSSLLNAEVTTAKLLLRLGKESERYVFNSVGHEIDLQGLIVLCRDEGDGSRPLGSPVKDSLEAKINEGTKDAVGLIYGTDAAELKVLIERFGQLLKKFGGASEVMTAVV